MAADGGISDGNITIGPAADHRRLCSYNNLLNVFAVFEYDDSHYGLSNTTHR